MFKATHVVEVRSNGSLKVVALRKVSPGSCAVEVYRDFLGNEYVHDPMLGFVGWPEHYLRRLAPGEAVRLTWLRTVCVATDAVPVGRACCACA